MENISLEIINNIAIMKINRPNVFNALNKSTVEEIDFIAEEIKKNEKIKVLIISSDNNFAAGADIKEMQNCNEEEAKLFSFSKTFNKVADLRIPTIAAIDGYALGGGLELALTCDFRIASDSAVLGFPEINLGIMPGAGGTVRTTRLIGESRTKELILLGDKISAQKAVSIGLVNEAVTKENLMSTAMKWAEKLSMKAPIAIKMAKQAIENATIFNTMDAINYEGTSWAELFKTADQKEGMKAFIEKRKPVYIGK